MALSMTYIKFFQGPVDLLGIDSDDIVVGLSCDGGLVHACNGAFGEFDVC